MNLDSPITQLSEKSLEFLQRHRTEGNNELCDGCAVTGGFSLHPGQSGPDLYGMLDAAYVYGTLGRLEKETDKDSRSSWAKRILACQDDDGWFSKRNLRGHPREHATAYAIGALRLLELEPNERYVERIKPLEPFLPILTDYDHFQRWIERLGFRLSLPSLVRKNLGWHYVWRGSHVGAGVPAAAGMVGGDIFDHWWPNRVDLDRWFTWYVDWLDVHASPDTGYWQRAFWNLLVRKPTLIDMGGAVHFLWIYQALHRPFPYPEQVIRSTLQLQRPSGLYGHHPFCVDLDGNFCLIRSYRQLPADRQRAHRDRVYEAVERNFEAVVRALTEKSLEEIYADSHGLPGALAALVECAKLPGFRYTPALSGWQHPLDQAWWL